ncbi:hypothetical protein ASC66_10350 [Leifsonia sp. Root4]|uniref:aggregation-promoting factor C-terminal-like domain-containing protein n=1 Tax=Leifsonia sp. Root4 TaxID=1736525 RepID=UPI0006F23EAC|nr:lytic transglycosylase domain-containing protein [Leifsonia sp. Root4]KQW05408.1 hypothetical protein ASC66_10350 [Leifsonia sp. Root4]
MPNSNSPTIRPSSPSTNGATRVQRLKRRRGRSKILVAGAVVAISAVAGTGFVLQSTVVAHAERVAATAALNASTGLASEQLSAYTTVAEAHAARAASITLDQAGAVLAAAEGKTDAGDLASSVAALSNFELLAPGRVFTLVDSTKDKVATVQAATAEVDRVAAEHAAAEAAAAAAAAAAAEAAAAEEAASAGSGSSGSSSGSRPSAPTDPSGAQAIARDLMAAQYGWGEDQFGCLVALWNKESGWNVNAYNASSGATGIPQALPGSKMASAGDDWATNPATQITWGLGYIAGRYGTPCGAWDTSQSQGWY